MLLMLLLLTSCEASVILRDIKSPASITDEEQVLYIYIVLINFIFFFLFFFRSIFSSFSLSLSLKI